MKHIINEDFYFTVRNKNPKPSIGIYNHAGHRIWEWTNLREYKDFNEWIERMKRITKVFLDEMLRTWYRAAMESREAYVEVVNEYENRTHSNYTDNIKKYGEYEDE